MKKFLLIGGVMMALMSCADSNSSENDSSENETTNTASANSENKELFIQDWETFKQAVINKDKDAVLFFAVKHDQSLRDVFDLSYDYIFDDIMIESIEDMTYSDLGQHEKNLHEKLLIITYPSSIEAGEEKSQSQTILFFEERPEGLRIVNFIAAG